MSSGKWIRYSAEALAARKAAIDAGESTYDAGDSGKCVHGHSLRYTASNRCVTCKMWSNHGLEPESLAGMTGEEGRLAQIETCLFCFEKSRESFDVSCVECAVRFLEVNRRKTGVLSGAVQEWSPDFKRRVVERLEAGA